ncbi:hypothetical protein [Sulfitobacter pontiacus]|uniref:hypothetical protein n=1 Tax=Sulfitobacter pontiacus TaxID=60137 RepID=UPI0021A5C62E|nr:hypothetical protein [Sulfitobacter pontiacus]UWR20202.1 hypothetical protein K3755_07050 [Sulfitobacter pontiacus]
MPAEITKLSVPVVGTKAEVHITLEDKNGSVFLNLAAEAAVTEEEVRELAKDALNEALKAI